MRALLVPLAVVTSSCLLTSSFDDLSGGVRIEQKSCPLTAPPPPPFCRSVKADVVNPEIDARADEFCGRTEPSRIVLFDGPLPSGPRPADPSPIVWIRVGWHARGLHVHVAVEQPTVNVTPDIALWKGDSVELYAGGGDPARLTGPYGSVSGDKGVVHAMVAPPANSLKTRATMLGGDVNQMTYAARRVTDGYEVEALIPWPLITPFATKEPPNVVELNVAVNYVSKGVRYQNIAHFVKRDPVLSGCADGHPACDDRTWCRVSLGTF